MHNVPFSLRKFWTDVIRATFPSKSEAEHLDLETVGGGSINQAYRIRINHELQFFCKTNDRNKYPGLFESEKKGLELLNNSGTIRTPKIISSGEHVDYQYLMLEWIEPGVRNKKFWREFGEALARQHNVKWNQFGWEEDNYMGALRQSNRPHADWISFYICERLEPQIKLSVDKRLLDQSHNKQFEELFHSLKNIFSVDKPCLVHGDLWSGNFICDKNSQPILIDPAVYFGHRMVDIGMTKLFGGFDEEFYEAYHYQYPITGEEEEQISVCQLYPLLIHLNLFGRSYLYDIVSILDHLT